MPEPKVTKIQDASLSLLSIGDIDSLAQSAIPRAGEHRAKQSGRPPPGTPEAVDQAMDMLIARLLPIIQRHLDENLVGKDFGREVNSQLAKSLTRMLRRLGVLVECKCGTPVPAIRYVDSGKGPSWVWRYEHSGSVRHGGTKGL